MTTETTAGGESTTPTACEARGTALRRSRITDRDRQLFGFLATARYLSTAQLARLVFPGRGNHVVDRRLRALSGEGPSAIGAPPLRRLTFRPRAGGWITLWSLSPAGYAEAERDTSGAIKVPGADVGEAFMEHTVALNDLYVGLVTATFKTRAGATLQGLSSETRSAVRARRLRGLYPRWRALPFRWIGEESSRLPWREYDVKLARRRERAIQPDATLEFPGAKRRFFIEQEMGTHPILPQADGRPGATITKVERYETFFSKGSAPLGRRTFYEEAFPDLWPAEVLFVVLSASRAKAVNDAVARWRKDKGHSRVLVTALTGEKALAQLASLVPGTPADDAPREALPPGAPLVSPNDVQVMREFYLSTVNACDLARTRATSEGRAPPEYPERTREMHALIKRFVDFQRRQS
jgi:hypothetical protein